MNLKKTAILAALLFTSIAGQSTLRAAIVVNITKGSPTDTFLTMGISGSATVLSLDSADQWNVNALTSSIWRILDRDTTNNIFNTSWLTDNTSSSGITASSGFSTLNMNTVSFAAFPGLNFNYFSFGFDANPSPLWQIGDVVTFSGTATINLTTPNETAGMFNPGTWSGYASVNSEIWASQFGDSPGLFLTLNIGGGGPAAVPEPGTWAAAALLAGAAGYVRWRRRKS